MTESAIAIAMRNPDGHETYAEHGNAILEHEVPASASTVFNVGSVAKQITAYLAIRMHHARVLDLGANIRRYLPRVQIDDVTVGELITHTAGFRDAETLLSLCGYRDLDHYTADDLLNLAYRQQARAVPREQFLYSNTHYLLLAKLLEITCGTPLARLAADEIFTPLGMADTQFIDDQRTLILHAAASYENSNGQVRKATRPVALAGPGSLWTSTRDLMRWLLNLHQLWVSGESEHLPFGEVFAYVPADRAEFAYGPGLYATSKPAQSVFHNGHEHGFSASTILGRDGAAILCVANASWTPAERLISEIRRLAVPPQCASDALRIALERGTPISARERETQPSTRRSESGDTQLGVFAASDVPGRVQLLKIGKDLALVRRGTRDLLTPLGTTGKAFCGPGFVLTLDPATGDGDAISSFMLDLDRAPRIRYTRLAADLTSSPHVERDAELAISRPTAPGAS
ncbi:MAG TPA: serine hydrolase domain-containing protein [Actinocrinis sp.]|uniref:serine hydrolase domain-containing protein n=1 Tax=Actinocrinis sp. TaxID=1920516 RepID=UPI002DDCDF51|nr:serine hydrolase domain-containing protein [Actinocrinis sp.]HEV2346998.1 serine hydrolase domain-containing protein [Actinocrinis sp.]